MSESLVYRTVHVAANTVCSAKVMKCLQCNWL